MLWLKIPVLNTRIQLELSQGLVRNTWFWCHKHGCRCPRFPSKMSFFFVAPNKVGKCPQVSYEIASDAEFINIGTPRPIVKHTGSTLQMLAHHLVIWLITFIPLFATVLLYTDVISESSLRSGTVWSSVSLYNQEFQEHKPRHWKSPLCAAAGTSSAAPQLWRPFCWWTQKKSNCIKQLWCFNRCNEWMERRRAKEDETLQVSEAGAICWTFYGYLFLPYT